MGKQHETIKVYKLNDIDREKRYKQITEAKMEKLLRDTFTVEELWRDFKDVITEVA